MANITLDDLQELRILKAEVDNLEYVVTYNRQDSDTLFKEVQNLKSRILILEAKLAAA